MYKTIVWKNSEVLLLTIMIDEMIDVCNQEQVTDVFWTVHSKKQKGQNIKLF